MLLALAPEAPELVAEAPDPEPVALTAVKRVVLPSVLVIVEEPDVIVVPTASVE